MVKLNEVSTEVLKKYTYNLDKLDDLTDKLIILNREVERLQEENDVIEKTGKLPSKGFCQDDIPF